MHVFFCGYIVFMYNAFGYLWKIIPLVFKYRELKNAQPKVTRKNDDLLYVAQYKFSTRIKRYRLKQVFVFFNKKKPIHFIRNLYSYVLRKFSIT